MGNFITDLFEAFSRRRLDSEKVAQEVDRLESEFFMSSSLDEETSPYFIKCIKTVLSKQTNEAMFIEGKRYPCKTKKEHFMILIDEQGRIHGVTDEAGHGTMDHFEHDNPQHD